VIAHTLEQAAVRIDTPLATLEAWIAAGELRAVRNPIDGQTYIEEQHLLEVDRDKAIRVPGRTWKLRLPMDLLLRHLADHSQPVTERALRDWIAEGLIAPVVPGRRGRGGAALFDPDQVLPIVAARRLRLMSTTTSH
jgi:hypothetical protein